MLKFVGRLGVERFTVEKIGADGKPELDANGVKVFETKEREVQQFRAGGVTVSESREKEGGEIESRSTVLSVKEIGKEFAAWDETDVLRRYPASFRKV